MTKLPKEILKALQSGKVLGTWIKDSAACMPNSCWGSYRRIGIAVYDTEIGAHANIAVGRGELWIDTWEKLFAGKTDNCAFSFSNSSYARLVAHRKPEAPTWD